MSQLIIPDIDSSLLQRLGERAAIHGRTVETEAKCILAEAVHTHSGGTWAAADQIRARLSASGRTFSDSVALLHEDR